MNPYIILFKKIDYCPILGAPNERTPFSGVVNYYIFNRSPASRVFIVIKGFFSLTWTLYNRTVFLFLFMEAINCNKM